MTHNNDYDDTPEPRSFHDRIEVTYESGWRPVAAICTWCDKDPDVCKCRPKGPWAGPSIADDVAEIWAAECSVDGAFRVDLVGMDLDTIEALRLALEWRDKVLVADQGVVAYDYIEAARFIAEEKTRAALGEFGKWELHVAAGGDPRGFKNRGIA